MHSKAAHTIAHLLRNDSVLTIAGLLALVSCLFVPPSEKLLESIDLNVLLQLFCLMGVVAGLRRCGCFDMLSRWLAHRAATTRSLAMMLMLCCFFSSMLITNDVALIVFVPFTLEVLKSLSVRKGIIRIVTAETLAANLGSMLTPIGNPQNLYLFSLSNAGLIDFIALLAPYALLSLVLLAAMVRVFVPSDTLTVSVRPHSAEDCTRVLKRKLFLYAALLCVCVLAVTGIVPDLFMLALVLAALLMVDRKALASVDYMLLLTFVFFFVLIGNLKEMPVVYNFLQSLVTQNVFLASVAASQVISNVPTACLIPSFSNNIAAITVAVDIGGCGTLIASMASLISYRFFVAKHPSRRMNYLGAFTLFNFGFLAILIIQAHLLGAW